MTFSKEVADWARKAEGLQREQVEFICYTLLTDLVMGTPVDTGRARGNWQASIGAPVLSQTARMDKSGRQTINAEKPAVAQAPGTVFYLTNNLPYIYRLEFEGWSKQAPSGWVRYSVERAKAIAARSPRG